MPNASMSSRIISPSLFICILSVFYCQVVKADNVQHFDIWQYQVNGNNLLEASTVESVLYQYLGSEKTLKTVEKARDDLQKIYKSHGYPIVVVSIPQQNVIGGMVTLDVIEGKIDRLKISGNKYFSRRDLRKEIPSLKPGLSLNMEQARKEIDLANQANPYRSVVPVIRPGKHRGTIEMELKVKDRLPVNAYIEANNRYTSNTSPARVLASAGYDNLWQKNHSVSFSYQISPQEPDEVSVINFSYALPSGDGSKLVMYAVKSDSSVAIVTGQGDGLNVLGKGSIYGLRSTHRLTPAFQYYHSLIFGLDYKDFGETQSFSNVDSTADLNVPITYASWSLSYSGTINKKTTTQFSLGANFGLRGINDAQEFEYKRYNAKANYFYMGGNVSQIWRLIEDIELRYDFKGQYSAAPLISNEQYSAGGMDTVRGYIDSSVLGDNALQGSVELILRSLIVENFDFSFFVDAARLRSIDVLPDEEGNINNRTSLLGAGLGFYLNAFKAMELKLYVAKPVYELDKEDFDSGTRVHFSLGYRF
jgi:hemolysin activation/secretion protein